MHDHLDRLLNNMEISPFALAGKALIMVGLLEKHANTIDDKLVFGRLHMNNKSPQKIKLDVSKLLGYNTQGIVMAGTKPVGSIKPSSPPKPTIGVKPIVG
jgi:hypothetical protein